MPTINHQNSARSTQHLAGPSAAVWSPSERTQRSLAVARLTHGDWCSGISLRRYPDGRAARSPLAPSPVLASSLSVLRAPVATEDGGGHSVAAGSASRSKGTPAPPAEGRGPPRRCPGSPPMVLPKCTGTRPQGQVRFITRPKSRTMRAKRNKRSRANRTNVPK